MEHREQYNPDDLEHLMLERSFAELPEEERAYALRHVADAAEYGRMRALLQRVHAQKQDMAAQDAGPEVRAQVLQAFRRRHRPEWRFSLNSFSAPLLPLRSLGLWRPALAMGALVLAVLTVLKVQEARETDRPKQLAEVPVIRQAQQPAAAPPAEALPAQSQAAAHNADGLGADTRPTESSRLKRMETRAQGNAVPPAPPPVEPGTSAYIAVESPAGRNKAEPAEAEQEANAMAPAHAPLAKASANATTEEVMDAAAGKHAALKEGSYTEADLLGLLQPVW